MKLKFFINSEGKKIYTLKEEVNSEKTKDAHYKFLGLRDAPITPRNWKHLVLNNNFYKELTHKKFRMKTEVNYSRKYTKKQREDYYNLILEIRENSIDETEVPRKFIIYDGDFLLRLSSNFIQNDDFHEAKIKIEKWGKDTNLEKQSEIEKLLIENKFKLDKTKSI